MTGFREMPLSRFAEALASGAPTPGGGSASALAGALAAALVAMVARITAESEKFADRAVEMGEAAAEADGLQEELLALVDEDAAAFDQVMAAFRMPRETSEQQAARSEAIQDGYRAAVEPPTLVCARSLRLLELAVLVAERGNPNAVSDAGVAAHLAMTALEGAALNVEINLGSVRNEEYRKTREERLQAVKADGRSLRDRALATVRAKLA